MEKANILNITFNDKRIKADITGDVSLYDALIEVGNAIKQIEDVDYEGVEWDDVDIEQIKIDDFIENSGTTTKKVEDGVL